MDTGWLKHVGVIVTKILTLTVRLRTLRLAAPNSALTRTAAVSSTTGGSTLAGGAIARIPVLVHCQVAV
jgi:hypothetical protein